MVCAFPQDPDSILMSVTVGLWFNPGACLSLK